MGERDEIFDRWKKTEPVWNAIDQKKLNEVKKAIQERSKKKKKKPKEKQPEKS